MAVVIFVVCCSLVTCGGEKQRKKVMVIAKSPLVSTISIRTAPPLPSTRKLQT